MSLEVILGVLGAIGAGIIAFLKTNLGSRFLVIIYNILGKIVEDTDNEIDDKIHEAAPEYIEATIEAFDLGVADEILESFLEDLEEIDADTTKLEDIFKQKREDIKKN